MVRRPAPTEAEARLGQLAQAARAAGRARVAFALHRGSPLGPAHTPALDLEGVIDFRGPRVRLCGERLCQVSDGDVWYVGPLAGGRWRVVQRTDHSRRGPRDLLWLLGGLGQLRAAPVELGPARHRGDPVVRYRVEVEGLGRSVEVWVDERGRPRVLAGVPEEAGRRAALPGTLSRVLTRWVVWGGEPAHVPAGPVVWHTLELWDFGVEAHIEVPRPDQIVPPHHPSRRAVLDPRGLRRTLRDRRHARHDRAGEPRAGKRR